MPFLGEVTLLVALAKKNLFHAFLAGVIHELVFLHLITWAAPAVGAALVQYAGVAIPAGAYYGHCCGFLGFFNFVMMLATQAVGLWGLVI